MFSGGIKWEHWCVLRVGITLLRVLYCRFKKVIVKNISKRQRKILSLFVINSNIMSNVTLLK